MMDPSPSAKPLPEKNDPEVLPTRSIKALPADTTLSREPSSIVPDSREVERAGNADAEGNQEVDIWWGSYAGRTMTPSFVVCALLTGIIIWGVWIFWPANEDRPYLMRYTDYILVGAVWLFQLVRWGYRIIGINYRLTSKRLFCQRGFQTSASRAIDLTQIATVRVERLALVNFLKVGRLRVVPIEDSQPPLVLESVPNPDHVAATIMKQVKQAREQTNLRH
jgi:hypothetical protein